MFAENFIKARTERNWSKYRAAKVIGVHPTTICNWERGINEPCASLIVKIAEVFDMTCDELLK